MARLIPECNCKRQNTVIKIYYLPDKLVKMIRKITTISIIF